MFGPDYWPDIQNFNKEQRIKFVEEIRSARKASKHSNEKRYTNGDMYAEVTKFHGAYNHYNRGRIKRDNRKAVIIETDKSKFAAACNRELADIEKQGNKKTIPGYLAWLCKYHSDQATVFYDEVIKKRFRPYVEAEPTTKTKSTNSGKHESDGPIERNTHKIQSYDGSLSPNNKIIAQNPNERRPHRLSEKALPIELELPTKSIDSFIETQNQGYEFHEIETDFVNFFKTKQSGIWLLAAGPGMGKTAIMAHIASIYKEICLCIPYIFRVEYASSEENKASGFYDYVLKRLMFEFDLDEKIYEDQSTYPQKLQKLIFRLHELGHISQENPLLLLVDGLDEMHFGYDSSKNRNPLEFPLHLPKGVFVAYSVRIEMNQTVARAAIPRHDFCSTLEADRGAHRKTVFRYVRKICEQSDYIRPYHMADSRQSSEIEKLQFIESCCERAQHNFMILRLLLTDRDYWESGGTGIELTGNLNDYYESHFERMLSLNDQRLNSQAALCFALMPQISRFAFEILMCRKNSRESMAAVKEILARWIIQGLVREELQGLINVSWLSAYHRTYHEFLEAKLNQHDRYSFLIPFAENLAGIIDNDLDLSSLGSEPPEIFKEWIILTLRLLIRIEKTDLLSRVLNNLHFWNLAARCDGGIGGVVIDIIGYLTPRKQSWRAFDNLLTDVAKNLEIWVDQKMLIDARGNPFALRELLGIVTYAGQGDGKADALIFLKYFDLE